MFIIDERLMDEIVTFSTQVQDVRMDDEHWEVTAKSTITQKETTARYDAIIIANGHYSVPFIPFIPGIESFNSAYPSAIRHSKQYRSPRPFLNQKVIVVGSGASGLDIGTQISHVCRKPLLNSVKTPSPLKLGQENKEEVSPIAEFLVKERGVRFEDGRVEKDIDAIIYCTGYLYSYPFLKHLDPAVVTDGRRVRGLHTSYACLHSPLTESDTVSSVGGPGGSNLQSMGEQIGSTRKRRDGTFGERAGGTSWRWNKLSCIRLPKRCRIH